MLQLHFLFQLRACCALLALNRSQEAGEDVMTSLRLAQLARQSPDVKSSTRVQMMVVRSLQPIWEGLVEHRWSEPQLAAFQKELGEFNLLSDHTNAIRRATLAYMETWRSRAEGKSASAGSPRGGDGYEREWQPRAWWLDNSIELYRAAQKAIARVDVASGKVDGGFEWIDLDGLPLDGDTAQLFQLSSWNVGPTFVSYAQTAVNQAILACALDRYRLAHGAYPETLEPLQPDYLSKIPNDILRGIPMFYRLNDKNSYALRGVGPNGVIDQGKMPPDDWVWAFSAQTNLPPAKVIKKK